MLEKVRVGLEFIANQHKYQVAVNIEALTKAVSSLSRIERPQLYLIVTDETLTGLTLSPPYISLFAGVIHIGADTKKAAATFGSSLIQITSYDQLFEKIDYYFTTSPDVLPNQQAAIWISAQAQDWQVPQIKKIADNATTIVFTDCAAKQAFLEAYPLTKAISKYISIPFYPENEWYEGDPHLVQHNYGLPDKFALCSNHFWLANNHPALFRAIALLRRQGQDVHLVCTGLTTAPQQSGYFQELQEYSKKIGITDLIHILGPLPHLDIIQLIRRSFFVVHPSLDENLSTMIQQCRALAKPIILPGNDRHLAQGHIPITDYKDLAKKISILLSMSQPGPDLQQEAAAKQESANLIKYCARQFCDIVRESPIIIDKVNRTSRLEQPSLISTVNEIKNTVSSSAPMNSDNQQPPKPVGANTEASSSDPEQPAEAKQESTNWAKCILKKLCDILEKVQLIIVKNEPVSHPNQPSPVNSNEVATVAAPFVPPAKIYRDKPISIGFAMRWPKGKKYLAKHFIGEEEYAASLCSELRQMSGVQSVELYAPNCMPSARIDVMIHLNETMPGPFARKHVLYMQNFFAQGSDVALNYLQKMEYDGYIFVSNKLLELHRQAGYNGLLLPLAADTAIFQPKPTNPKFEYDVAYVGNDIKGEERTMRYLYPAIKYNFGLFGDWQPSTYSVSSSGYRDLFAKLSQGVITPEEQAVLYASAKIILNCTGQDSVDWDAMNLRFFEVLACKGFLISDKVPSAQRELNGCVVFTDGSEDLVAKIDYYLSRPKERAEIAENGYQYVIQNATVQARAKQLYSYIQKIME